MSTSDQRALVYYRRNSLKQHANRDIRHLILFDIKGQISVSVVMSTPARFLAECGYASMKVLGISRWYPYPNNPITNIHTLCMPLSYKINCSSPDVGTDRMPSGENRDKPCVAFAISPDRRNTIHLTAELSEYRICLQNVKWHYADPESCWRNCSIVVGCAYPDGLDLPCRDRI